MVHGVPVEYLILDDLLVEAGGANRDEIPGLVIHRVLFVADLHYRCFVLHKWIIHCIAEAKHLVDEDGVRLQVIGQAFVVLVDQDRERHFVLKATLEVNQGYLLRN